MSAEGDDDEFFERLKPWSYWKHQILSKYLQVFVRKLGLRRQDLVFVDGCAGAGRYESGEDGSPVIAAKKNDELRPKGKRLLVIAVEERPGNLRALNESLAPWIAREEAIVIAGTFETHLAEILEFTKGVPTLFFIDAYSNPKPSQLRAILDASERGQTELLVRFNPNGLARLVGKLRRGEEVYRERIEEIVRPDILTALMEADDQPPDVQTPMHEEYLLLLRQRFTYVQSIAIREDYSSAPKYFLEHATQSPDGAALMNDCVSTTLDDQFKKEIEANPSPQTSLFDPVVLKGPPARSPYYSPMDLDAAIVEYLADGKLRSVIEVRAELAVRLGAQFRKPHHLAALRRLIEKGRLQAFDGKVTEEQHRIRLTQ